MAADNKVTNIEDVKKEATVSDELTVELSKEYNFEGEKVKVVDFSGLENVTAKTMIKANKVLTTAGDVQLLPESSLHYALIIASECTKYPIEFYEGLCPKDAMKIKNTVTTFFYGEE